MEPHPDLIVPSDQPAEWEQDPRVRDALAMALAMALTPIDAPNASLTKEGPQAEAALERLLAARAIRVAQPGVSPSVSPSASPGDHSVQRHPRSRVGARRWIVAICGVTAAALAIVGVPAVRVAYNRVTVGSHLYTSRRAQRVAVTLPDGSNVILAPETQLRFSIDERHARIIELIGEAFFTVTPKPDQPFLVRTGAVTTRVLGTAFDIQRYAGDRVTQIAVVSGRVATGGPVAPVVVPAGAVAHATDSSVTVSAGDPDRIVAWTQGRLIFRNASVTAMLAALGRWYGYEFRLADSVLAESHVSIGFNADQPEEALNTVKAVLGVSMTFDGNVITLRPEHGAPSSSEHKISEPRRHSNPEVGK